MVVNDSLLDRTADVDWPGAGSHPRHFELEKPALLHQKPFLRRRSGPRGINALIRNRFATVRRTRLSKSCKAQLRGKCCVNSLYGSVAR
jgi:hypothetical protein